MIKISLVLATEAILGNASLPEERHQYACYEPNAKLLISVPLKIMKTFAKAGLTAPFPQKVQDMNKYFTTWIAVVSFRRNYVVSHQVGVICIATSQYVSTPCCTALFFLTEQHQKSPTWVPVLYSKLPWQQPNMSFDEEWSIVSPQSL